MCIKQPWPQAKRKDRTCMTHWIQIGNAQGQGRIRGFNFKGRNRYGMELKYDCRDVIRNTSEIWVKFLSRKWYGIWTFNTIKKFVLNHLRPVIILCGFNCSHCDWQPITPWFLATGNSFLFNLHTAVQHHLSLCAFRCLKSCGEISTSFRVNCYRYWYMLHFITILLGLTWHRSRLSSSGTLEVSVR